MISDKFKSNIIKIYTYHFILGIHTVRGVYIPYMTIWGGLTFFEIMLLQSFFTFMIFILEIPSGAISDLIGRKFGLVLSAIIIASAAFFYSIIPNFFLFMLAEGLWAFGVALYSGTDEAFTYSTLQTMEKVDDLPKILGRNQTLRLIALTISAPLGSIIAELFSLQFTMTCLGFIYITGFLVALTFKEPKSEDVHITSKKYLSILKDGILTLKKNKTLRILAFDRIIIDVLVFFLFWTYQPYLQELNIPILFFGFITSLMNIVNATFMFLVPKFSQRIKSKLKLLILFDLVNGVSYILLGITFNEILGIIIILIIVAFGYPRYLLYVNGINRHIESNNRATVLSTVNMFGSLIRAVIYPFIGIIVMWNIFALFIIIGIMIIFFTVITRVKSEYL